MTAIFEFSGGGLGVMPDPDDNPAGHDVPHHEAGVRISEEIVNVGDETGVMTIGVEIDGTYVGSWDSDPLEPGQSEVLYLNLGRLTAGPHEILVYLNSGSGLKDHETNNINLP